MRDRTGWYRLPPRHSQLRPHGVVLYLYCLPCLFPCPPPPPLCDTNRLKQFPREQVLKETDAVFADIRKQYPSVKKIGVQG
jgi:hypothetical protein